jgi:hypothetical protein
VPDEDPPLPLAVKSTMPSTRCVASPSRELSRNGHRSRHDRAGTEGPSSALAGAAVLGIFLFSGCGEQATSSAATGHDSLTSPRDALTGSPPSSPSSSPSASPSRSVELADITRVGVVHRQHNAIVRITVADDAALWRCAMNTGDYFEIYLDSNGDEKHEREIFYPWNCGAAEVLSNVDDDGRLFCRIPPATLDTATDTFTLVVPASCLGNPAQLRASAYMYSERPGNGQRRFPADKTDWTRLATVGETSSISDPVGDTSRHTGA